MSINEVKNALRPWIREEAQQGLRARGTESIRRWRRSKTLGKVAFVSILVNILEKIKSWGPLTQC